MLEDFRSFAECIIEDGVMCSAKKFFGGVIGIIVLSIFVIPGVALAQQPKIQLLLPVSYHGNELPKETGGNWYGIYKTTSGYELKKTRFQIKTVLDGVVDDVGPNAEKTGKEVVVKGKTKPLFMIQGVEPPRAGVKAAIFESGTVGPHQIKKIEFNGEIFTLSVGGVPKDPYTTKDFKVIFGTKASQKVLFEWPETSEVDAGDVELIWAGDLNGDDKLDLFVRPTYHYNLADYQLFLSSGGNLQIAARLALSGC